MDSRLPHHSRTRASEAVIKFKRQTSDDINSLTEKACDYLYSIGSSNRSLLISKLQNYSPKT
jgi:hypothetical protein